ncbi:Maf family protein [Marinomonas sp. THO17]|uniref:Maf family protein n=1 Tax=Marinomonas sp. THO17 TaxID=3149048 RepID=UPI00336C11DE
MQQKLILGSSSPYRKALLQRLNLSFECVSPNIDEQPLIHESPEALVKRLTISKAQAVAEQIDKCPPSTTSSIIIASDQVAVLHKDILGKPHTHTKAIAQLTRFSGEKVSFLTGLCVFNTATQKYDYSLVPYHVHFRQLSEQEIVNYVSLEQPLDCAGSFKCEGLGVTLFEKMAGDDPTALIGLPLIELCRLLRKQGINPLEMNDKLNYSIQGQ